MKLTFLHAAVPLTKQYTLTDATITTKAYPLVSNVTSTITTANTIQELHTELKKHSSKHCFFIGELARDLNNESRRGLSLKDKPTELLILDLDKAPFTNHQEFMKAMGLENLSYIWQWSSSAKVYKTKTISGHIFIVLKEAVNPRAIKAWLMHMNLSKEVLKKHIVLSNAKIALHWPLDIVVNDSGRIMYIADPIFIGMTSPIAKGQRIELIPGVNQALDFNTLPTHPMEALKITQRKLLNELRHAEHLPSLKQQVKIIDDFEIQSGVGEATTYEVLDDGSEFIRYNINGGDSAAYWHPRNNFELLHNFKGEPSTPLKEILPGRYAEMIRLANVINTTPNTVGDMLIAFRNKHTNKYHKGHWNEGKRTLDMQTTESPLVLNDFVKQFGASLGDYIPEWDVEFNPRSATVYDPVKMKLNTFICPPMLVTANTTKGEYKIIQKVLDHAVGTGDIQEKFLNWLAVIAQKRIKTRTTWILHGIQGTGKGLLSQILGRVFERHITYRRAAELREQFNGWMESALIAFVDEIESDMFEASVFESNLKNFTTDSPITIRRMRTDAYEAKSYINFIFSSNKPLPIKLPPTDRRNNVAAFGRVAYKPSSYEVDVAIPREIPHFAHYLLTRIADERMAGEIHQNADRELMQSLSITSVDEFARDITTGNIHKLIEYLPDEQLLLEHGLLDPSAAAYMALTQRFLNESVSTISRDELAMMFTHAIGKVPEGANKFTSFLRHHNINTKRVWNGTHAVYGITVTWDITTEERIALINDITPTRSTKAKVINIGRK